MGGRIDYTRNCLFHIEIFHGGKKKYKYHYRINVFKYSVKLKENNVVEFYWYERKYQNSNRHPGHRYLSIQNQRYYVAKIFGLGFEWARLESFKQFENPVMAMCNGISRDEVKTND